MLNRKTYSDENGQMVVEFSNFETFLEIALKAECEVEKIVKCYDEMLLVCASDYMNCQEHLNDAIQRETMIVIVFCLASLEAFINYYAVKKLSKSFLKKYLEKLDIKSKWVIVPKLANGKSINTDHQGFQYLDKLNELRNSLMHSKPKVKKLSEVRYSDWLSDKDADIAIKAVFELVKELKQIDDREDIKWLYKAKVKAGKVKTFDSILTEKSIEFASKKRTETEMKKYVKELIEFSENKRNENKNLDDPYEGDWTDYI